MLRKLGVEDFSKEYETVDNKGEKAIKWELKQKRAGT